MLTELLKKDHIVIPLAGKNHQEIVTELVNTLPLDNKDTIIQAILNRELQASTVVSKICAIPHCTAECNASHIAIGIAATPIEFGKRTIQCALLLVVPQEDKVKKITMLATLARLSHVIDDHFNELTDVDKVYQLVISSGY